VTSEVFLNEEDVAVLTGIRTGAKGKSKLERQVAWLRTSGIPFWVNARGRPVVARAAVEGRRDALPDIKKTWVPDVLRSGDHGKKANKESEPAATDAGARAAKRKGLLLLRHGRETET
jgi:hypothetical protein